MNALRKSSELAATAPLLGLMSFGRIACGGFGPLGAVLGLKAIVAVYRADLFWLVVGAGDVPVGGCV
ncbi:hypothetical protein Nepgr_007815 [Nepenthes gracilis]|uniref:Uncharacterized protein n=1 Tax=Nepenthes gracilis TaxID=150966 RepID=A0AAD3S7N9_NEPGR|nr:hypothetical protein Nepgr_007815 [Nepenthes gracilis]